MSTTQTQTPNRWPVVLLAAAAVLAVVAGVIALRRRAHETVPATPTPTVIASSPATASASPSPSATPSASPTPSGSSTASALPVYYIGIEALGWPESGLGLRRDWISPPTVGADPDVRVRDALRAAMARSIDTEGGQTPWSGVDLGQVKATPQRIDVPLTAAPTTDLADNVSALAVQQLVWTAQAAYGKGNVPVHFSVPGGGTRLWSTDISRGQVRPTAAEQYTVLTDLWITDPPPPLEGSVEVAARTLLTVRGEASVFEANVQWQLARADGPVVDKGVVTASVGAPGRGTFSVPLTIAEPGDYVLKAYAVSAQDGQGETANDLVYLHVR